VHIRGEVFRDLTTTILESSVVDSVDAQAVMSMAATGELKRMQTRTHRVGSDLVVLCNDGLVQLSCLS
jgi:hypothetical protein